MAVKSGHRLLGPGVQREHRPAPRSAEARPSADAYGQAAGRAFRLDTGCAPTASVPVPSSRRNEIVRSTALPESVPPGPSFSRAAARVRHGKATKWPGQGPLARSCARQITATATKWPDRALAPSCARHARQRRPSGPTGPSRAQLRAADTERRPGGPTGPSRAQLRAADTATATRWPDRALSRAAARVKHGNGDQVARPGPLARSCARRHGTRGQVGASADALQAILACARIRPRACRDPRVIARNPAGVALFRAGGFLAAARFS